MAHQNLLSERHAALSIAWPICASGAALGTALSFAALSGDAQGRVNLLYLLVIFVAIPLISIVVSVFSLLFGGGIHLGRIVQALPVWSQGAKQQRNQLHQLHISKEWLFMQSQAAALAYALASVVVFAILLLVTDVNFVWRSTLLQPSHLEPILKLIAAPWWFWEAAQPSSDLLTATFDSRLQRTHFSTHEFARWWPFAMASLLFYAVFVRATFFFIARKIVLRKLANDAELTLRQRISTHASPIREAPQLGTVVSHLPEAVTMANWGGFEANFLKQLPHDLGHIPIAQVGPLNAESSPESSSFSHNFRLILVKSWEPPMGELKDFLEEGTGLIFPVDIQQNKLAPPKPTHLEEWRRFAFLLPNWQIYLPSEWTAIINAPAQQQDGASHG